MALAAFLQQYFLLILIGIFVFVVVLWGIPKWQASDVKDLKDRLTLENAARQALAQIIGGTVLIAGLFFTWANLQIAQETATKSQDKPRHDFVHARAE